MSVKTTDKRGAEESKGKFGGNLGKTTGWIHRSNLKKKNVQFIGEVTYSKIDDQGLHYIQNEKEKILDLVSHTSNL